MVVMVIPRTHCHFTTLGVRCAFLILVTTTLRHRAWLPTHLRSQGVGLCIHRRSLSHRSHSGGLVTFLACALHQLFVRSCDLAHHGLYCSHVYVCTHHSSLQALSFRCLPSLFSLAHMDEPQNMRLPHGTTGGVTPTTRHSALRTTLSPSVTIWCELPAPCADIGLHTGATRCSDSKLSVSCPQFTHSAISSQVQTHTVTSDLLSATLAEAATQLWTFPSGSSHDQIWTSQT